MSQPPFDLAIAHHWFAADFNKRARDLAVKPGRTSDETQYMLHAAHAAALHWQAVRTPLCDQRAESLLATVLLKSGQAEPALGHALRALALSEQNVADQTPLDRATAFAVAAKAHNLAGNGMEALRLITLAVAEADNLTDDERSLFDRFFAEG